MNQILDFFKGLFDTTGFPARWNCGKGWTDFHGWLYIISDLLIWSAYFAIPLIIINYILKRKDLRFHKIYYLFAAFILSCGITHLLDAVIFWFPVYRLSALVLFITGVLSWITVYHLVKLAPVAFSLKSAEELEGEVENRKKAEAQLQVKIMQMNEAQAIARMGSWEWEVATNKVTWSAGLFDVYDLPYAADGMKYETFMEYVHPDDRFNVENIIKQAFKEKKFTDYYHRIISPAGKLKTLQAKGEIILDSQGEIIRMIGTGQDVSEQKKVEQELIIKSHELEEVNNELQKFAYIASHDLQEPLRKIKTYLSRLETENEQLISDDKSVKYFEKINSAASRMQKLMDDILNFSRLSSAQGLFEKIDLNHIVMGL